MIRLLTLKNFVITILVMLVYALPVLSLELDTSIDQEIKKKYNSSKLEDTVLPNLPNITPASSTPTPPKSLPNYNTTVIPAITPVNPKDGIKISSWTKFKVKSNQLISDWSKEGTVVSFTTTVPVYKKNITIPAGTVFKGVIINSHRPQITGNGGLVILKITSISYGGKTFRTDAKVTKANYKKIFFNNIKGKRQYWKGVANRINKGEDFYNKTKKISNKLSSNPIFIILSPFPIIVGAAGCTVCTILSPITAITTKGGNLSIPAGSEFEIKLLEPAYVK